MWERRAKAHPQDCGGVWNVLFLKEISAEYTAFSLPNYPLNHSETS